MISDYIKRAMCRAKYEILEDGTYYGEIAGFRGVWANAEALDDCRGELQEVLEEWIVLSLQMGHRLPRLPGVKPFPRRRVAS